MTAETKPDKVLQYHIPHDGVGEMYVFNGDTDHLVLLLPGFPDDHKAMIPLAQRMKQTTAVISLPGYDGRNMYPDGYTLEDWVTCFTNAKQVLLEQFPSSSGPEFSLLVHDWGVAAGTCFVNRFPDETTKLILLDVLGPPHKKAPKAVPNYPPPSTLEKFYTALGSSSYQLMFATVFALQRYIHKFAAMALFRVSVPILSVLRLYPIVNEDKAYFKALNLTNMLYMTYPYFYVWSNLLRGNGRIFKHFFIPTKVPVLYIYGATKFYQFHDAAGLDWVSQNNGGKVVAVDGAGHWMHWQEPDIVFNEIESFLAK